MDAGDTMRLTKTHLFPHFAAGIAASLVGVQLVFLVGMGMFCQIGLPGNATAQHFATEHELALQQAEALLAGAECDGDKTGDEEPKPDSTKGTAGVDAPEPPCAFCQTPQAFPPPAGLGTEKTIAQLRAQFSVVSATGYRAELVTALGSRAPPMLPLS